MPGELKSLCVFAGSRDVQDPIFATHATRLGELMAERGIHLVFGGGGTGLMGSIARAVHGAGGTMTGVIPRSMVEAERAYDKCDELIIVETMHERKTKMYNRAHGFAALPGGVGTFEELFEATAWDSIDIHDKPIGLLDTAQFYSKMYDFVKHAHDVGYVSKAVIDHLAISPDPGELLSVLEAKALHERGPRLGLKW